MRTTIDIDDVLMHKLKLEALRKKQPLGRILNAYLRLALQGRVGNASKVAVPTADLGQMLLQPPASLDKALLISSTLEDDHVLNKMEIGK